MLTQIVSQQNLRTRTVSPATNRLGDESEARLFLLDSDACFIDAKLRPVPPLIVRTRLLEVRLHPKHTDARDWFTAITTESLKMFWLNEFLQRRCPTMHVSCLNHPLANDIRFFRR